MRLSPSRLLFPIVAALFAIQLLSGNAASLSAQVDRPTLRVPAVEDFAVNGRGDHPSWEPVPWTALNARGGVADAPQTRMKVAWSARGLYVLMDGADRRLTASFEEDFSDLWKEDVFEAFGSVAEPYAAGLAGIVEVVGDFVGARVELMVVAGLVDADSPQDDGRMIPVAADHLVHILNNYVLPRFVADVLPAGDLFENQQTEFVARFVGADRGLKLLSLMTVSDLDLAPVDGAADEDLPRVTPDTTVRDALSLILLNDGRPVLVADADGHPRGIATLAVVSDALSEPAGR